MATGTLGTTARDYPARSYQLVAQIGTGGQAFVAGGSVGFKLGTIPAGSGILRASTVIGTVFNGTTPTVGLGTTSAGVDVAALAGGPITTLGSNAITLAATTVPFRSADTDIYVTWGSGAGNSAGQGIIVVEYAVVGGQ
jgi:hypothetical protein